MSAAVTPLPFRSAGGVRNQISETAQRRINEIRGRHTELLNEYRRLNAEMVELLGVQAMVGVGFGEEPTMIVTQKD